MTPPDFAPGAVQVWYTGTRSIADGTVRALERLLNAAETRRHLALRSPERRIEYVVAHALVRCALSRHDARDPASWAFRSPERGRPEIDPPGRLRFSLSHCEGLAVCAVADRDAVGVDAEPLTRGGAVLALGTLVLSRAEARALEQLETLGAREHRALVLWTLKEAYLKARGVGLSVPPDEVSFSLDRSGAAVLEAPRAGASSPDWTFWTQQISGCHVAVALDHPRESAAAPRFFAVDADSLATGRPTSRPFLSRLDGT